MLGFGSRRRAEGRKKECANETYGETLSSPTDESRLRGTREGWREREEEKVESGFLQAENAK